MGRKIQGGRLQCWDGAFVGRGMPPTGSVAVQWCMRRVTQYGVKSRELGDRTVRNGRVSELCHLDSAGMGSYGGLAARASPARVEGCDPVVA